MLFIPYHIHQGSLSTSNPPFSALYSQTSSRGVYGKMIELSFPIPFYLFSRKTPLRPKQTFVSLIERSKLIARIMLANLSGMNRTDGKRQGRSLGIMALTVLTKRNLVRKYSIQFSTPWLDREGLACMLATVFQGGRRLPNPSSVVASQTLTLVSLYNERRCTDEAWIVKICWRKRYMEVRSCPVTPLNSLFHQRSTFEGTADLYRG